MEDALSRKSMSSLDIFTIELRMEMERLGIDLTEYGFSIEYLGEVSIRPTLRDRIRKAQAHDAYF